MSDFLLRGVDARRRFGLRQRRRVETQQPVAKIGDGRAQNRIVLARARVGRMRRRNVSLKLVLRRARCDQHFQKRVVLRLRGEKLGAQIVDLRLTILCETIEIGVSPLEIAPQSVFAIGAAIGVVQRLAETSALAPGLLAFVRRRRQGGGERLSPRLRLTESALDLDDTRRPAAKLRHIRDALLQQRLRLLLYAALRNGGLGADLVALGDDFIHRQRHGERDATRRQTLGAATKGRQRQQRGEPRNQRAEREYHDLFNQARRPSFLRGRDHATRAARNQSAA